MLKISKEVKSSLKRLVCLRRNVFFCKNKCKNKRIQNLFEIDGGEKDFLDFPQPFIVGTDLRSKFESSKSSL